MSGGGATKKPSCAGSALSVRRTIGFASLLYIDATGTKFVTKNCKKIVKKLSGCRKYVSSQGITKKAGTNTRPCLQVHKSDKLLR
jgi:hypothetical protein